MSKIKFVQNKVYNYVKGKPVFELVCEVYAFGFLLPLAVMGITFMSYQIIFVGLWSGY